MPLLHPMPLYEKLPEGSRHTRILIVLPHEDKDATLDCALLPIDLDSENLAYEALSYYWGESKVLVPAIVNGHKVEITVNLNNALRRLRSKAGPRYYTIWADALCIDQRNETELHEQMSIMGEIYSRAKTVHAWLGDETPESEGAMNALEHFAQCTCHEIPPKRPREDATGDQAAEESERLRLGASLFESPYWERAWTVQELAMSSCIIIHQGRYHAAIKC